MAVRFTLSAVFLAAAAPLGLAAADAGGLAKHIGASSSEPWDYYDTSYNYCDPGYPSAQDYSTVPDAQLEFVQIVVRHGDRSPVHQISHDDTEWNCNGVLEEIYLHGVGQGQDNTTGSFQQQIEIPIWNQKYGYENQLWKGTCDVGELTDKGKAQHHLLGTQLRSVYIDKLGYLPQELSSTNELYARTTYIWRTKNSAESLLGALWPKRGISPDVAIPLHTYPKEIETMYGNSDACPRINTLVANISQSAHYQDFLKEQGPLMAKLAAIMGVKNASWDDSWDGYFDVLNARKCHGKPPICIPSLTGADANGKGGKSCTTDEDVVQVLRNANYEWSLKYRDNSLAKELTTLTIGSFVGTLRDHMAGRVAGKVGTPKLALYSGHDSTIWPLLAVLGASNKNAMWPPYASNLIFELWKKNNGGDRLVKVIFNGKPLELRKEDQWCDMNACPLSQFYARLEQYIPTDIVTQCA
ncbi:hypothetical protein EV175_000372 [Coemansia sp. RSA 1933]|nr:hypothetical protein EV175_000372 [Coemansia sp. RSA 1933]